MKSVDLHYLIEVKQLVYNITLFVINDIIHLFILGKNNHMYHEVMYSCINLDILNFNFMCKKYQLMKEFKLKT